MKRYSKDQSTQVSKELELREITECAPARQEGRKKDMVTCGQEHELFLDLRVVGKESLAPACCEFLPHTWQKVMRRRKGLFWLTVQRSTLPPGGESMVVGWLGPQLQLGSRGGEYQCSDGCLFVSVIKKEISAGPQSTGCCCPHSVNTLVRRVSSPSVPLQHSQFVEDPVLPLPSLWF